MHVLKLKNSHSKPVYYVGVKKDQNKAGKVTGTSIITTDKLEEAHLFDEYQEAGLTVIKPELNRAYDVVSFHGEAIAELKHLRATIKLIS